MELGLIGRRVVAAGGSRGIGRAIALAGRLGRPEEVANVMLFLASSLAIGVTAQIIPVNGGQGFGR